MTSPAAVSSGTPQAEGQELVLTQPWALAPPVALRPEPFGALAYHFGNRRLVFLRRPELVARKRNAHIEFATGPHRCLESNLARMELVTTLERFHERIPDYWITPGDEPQYNNSAVRMVPYLPVSFPAGGRHA
jgi:putative mycofactocin binding protein MftB